MASRIPIASRALAQAARTSTSPNSRCIAQQCRAFSQSRPRLAEVVAAPVRRPVGAFRGGLFGFLFGSTLAGFGMYYYVLEEYRVSNELLTEDIYNLHAAVQRTEAYIQTLEEQVKPKK